VHRQERKTLGIAALVLAGSMAGSVWVEQAAAQPPGFGGFGGAASPPAPARQAAPVDLTGTWVSLVTEDWIERMSPQSPPSGTGGGFGFGGRGGFGGGGPTPAPAASDDPCAAYGAGGIMRVPGRVRISWQDENTLLLEYDQGSQRRVFHFGEELAAAAVLSLQGFSQASWQGGTGGRGGRGRGGPQAGFGAPTDGRAGAAEERWGSLEVVTTNLSGGYLLTSKSYYGAGSTLTELIRYHSDFGNEYFTVTAIIEENGTRTSTTSSTFKKERDDSGFAPTSCEITPAGA
jgi:hypothetical protein